MAWCTSQSGVNEEEYARRCRQGGKCKEVYTRQGVQTMRCKRERVCEGVQTRRCMRGNGANKEVYVCIASLSNILLILVVIIQEFSI